MTAALQLPPGWIAAKGEPAPRILHIFSTFALGGPQRRFAAIANYFGDAFRHLIWPMDGRTDAQSLLATGGAWDIITAPFPKRNVVRNAFTARRALRMIDPDVLVTYNWGAVEWGAGNIPRLVRHVHIEDGFGPEEAHGQLARRVWFRRLVLNRHSTVVLPSRTLMRIATDIWRLDPARLIYLPNGIDCARFARAPDPALVATLKGRGPVIGTVATLRPEKALGRLVEAFAALRAEREVRLVIVGDGPERAGLEQRVFSHQLQNDVTFTGSLAEPERILGAFDIFALSSDTEQMPLSVLEAMAAGLPLASTNAGDVADMVAAENRPFVVEKSVSTLSGAIRRIVNDGALRANLARANRRKAAAAFDEKTMLAGYKKLFSHTNSNLCMLSQTAACKNSLHPIALI